MRMQKVLAILKSNSIFNVLNEKNVQRQPIDIDEPFEPRLPDGARSGLEVLPFAVPGKSAWYLEGKAHPGGDERRRRYAGAEDHATNRPASASTSSPPAPRSPTRSRPRSTAPRWCSSTARSGRMTR